MAKNFMKIAITINAGLLKIEEVVIVLCSLALVAALFYQVICRYVFQIPTAWAEEIGRYMFIWLTYLGTAYAYNYSSHIQIDIIDQVLDRFKNPYPKKKILNAISNIFTCTFLVIFLKIFIEFFIRVIDSKQTAPTTQIPMSYIMSGIIIGSALTICHGIYLLLCSITNTDSDKEIVPTSQNTVEEDMEA
jgi:TRAP-type C4-dicarboxylate transport system permease small subunit